MLDYEVLRAESTPVDWVSKEAPTRKRARPNTDCMVLLHRRDDFVFPVVAEIKFDNGETIREELGRPRSLDALHLSQEGEGGVGADRS